MARRTAWCAALTALLGTSCNDIVGMDPSHPARGPGQLVGNGDPITDGEFRGGDDDIVEARDVALPAEGTTLDCDTDCVEYCEMLDLENPVNIGLCPAAWGVGLDLNPIDRDEACRRLFADFIGRYPTRSEVREVCGDEDWAAVVRDLQARPEYLLVNQRRWADKLLYNNRAVNFERAWDMDDLVGKAYAGRVGWDEFAAVVSAHPIVMRRLDTPTDRAEFLFELFLGRPPYVSERGDIARLYRLWYNGYWEHPHVGRVPDAFIDFSCVDDEGNPDPRTIGQCTSVLWGHNELTLAPDRSRVEKEGDGDEEQEGMLWAGFLLPEEWRALQLPGRLIARLPSFWEFAIDETLERYLGYDLAIDAPTVRHELVRYLIDYGADIRALDFAIATSHVYLQSSHGDTPTPHRWTYGPLKQIEVEGWLDSIGHATGYPLSSCDHRLPHPEDYVGERAEEEGLGGWAYALVHLSRWQIDDEREVEFSYRNLARTLGGCPSNEVGGRFTTISVLNTAVQESFVSEVCGVSDGRSLPLDRLLGDLAPDDAIDPDRAEELLRHQQGLFFGRSPSSTEVAEVRAAAESCDGGRCAARAFARPLCFALLSSAEMLLY